MTDSNRKSKHKVTEDSTQKEDKLTDKLANKLRKNTDSPRRAVTREELARKKDIKSKPDTPVKESNKDIDLRKITLKDTPKSRGNTPTKPVYSSNSPRTKPQIDRTPVKEEKQQVKDSEKAAPTKESQELKGIRSNTKTPTIQPAKKVNSVSNDPFAFHDEDEVENTPKRSSREFKVSPGSSVKASPKPSPVNTEIVAKQSTLNTETGSKASIEKPVSKSSSTVNPQAVPKSSTVNPETVQEKVEKEPVKEAATVEKDSKETKADKVTQKSTQEKVESVVKKESKPVKEETVETKQVKEESKPVIPEPSKEPVATEKEPIPSPKKKDSPVKEKPKGILEAIERIHNQKNIKEQREAAESQQRYAEKHVATTSSSPSSSIQPPLPLNYRKGYLLSDTKDKSVASPIPKQLPQPSPPTTNGRPNDMNTTGINLNHSLTDQIRRGAKDGRESTGSSKPAWQSEHEPPAPYSSDPRPEVHRPAPPPEHRSDPRADTRPAPSPHNRGTPPEAHRPYSRDSNYSDHHRHEKTASPLLVKQPTRPVEPYRDPELLKKDEMRRLAAMQQQQQGHSSPVATSASSPYHPPPSHPVSAAAPSPLSQTSPVSLISHVPHYSQLGALGLSHPLTDSRLHAAAAAAGMGLHPHSAAAALQAAHLQQLQALQQPHLLHAAAVAAAAAGGAGFPTTTPGGNDNVIVVWTLLVSVNCNCLSVECKMAPCLRNSIVILSIESVAVNSNQRWNGET